MSIKINEENAGYRCFICWEDIDFKDTSTKIVSACNCISTDFKYTHKECLNLWINQNRRAGLKCQVCGTPFHIKKVLKPFKKIYKENWKKINGIFFGMILINILLWMLCVEWCLELERINSIHYEEGNELDVLSKYDENWYKTYDERESYLEEYANEIKWDKLFQNVYINIVTLFLFVNTSIISIYIFHEKDKFFEYSIDDAYEYKGENSSNTHFLLIKNHHRNISNNTISEDRNQGYNNNYEYQKIRVI